MNYAYKIITAENGFIISASPNDYEGTSGKLWVAGSARELGQLIEKLCSEDEGAKK